MLSTRSSRHPQRFLVRAQHDVRIEHREQRLKAAATEGLEEGLDELAPRPDCLVGKQILPAFAGHHGEVV
jgi:hypothetical protein